MEEKSYSIIAEDVGKRIDIFLKAQEPQSSRTALQELILKSKVFVNGKAVKPHYRLKLNDLIKWFSLEVLPCGLCAENIPLDIIFEDQDIIVLNKPSGLVVHPGAGNKEHTLVQALLFHTADLSSIGKDRPGIVHRLDKDTSGVMVVAKNNKAHLDLIKQFKKHTIERRYIALVSGNVEFDEGVIDVPLRRHAVDRKKIYVSFHEEAKPAQTIYHVLKRYPAYTALELFPQTGRTHQLRVHLNYLGCPILGDIIYGKKASFSRLALHAKDLGFIHPTTEKFVKFSSPLPPEMKAAVPGLKI